MTMKEKIFNIKLSGKTLMFIAGGGAIAITSFILGRLSKKGPKEELHNMATEKPVEAPAAAAPQA